MKQPIWNLGLIFFSSLLCSMAYPQDLYKILELTLENDPTLKQAEAQYRANRGTSIKSFRVIAELWCRRQYFTSDVGPADDVFELFQTR